MSCVPNVPPKDLRVDERIKLDERAKIEEFCELYPKLVGPIAGDLTFGLVDDDVILRMLR